MRRTSFNTAASNNVTQSGIFRGIVTSIGSDDLLSVRIPRLGLENIYEGIPYAGPAPAVGDVVFLGFLEGKSGSFVAFTGVAYEGNTGDPAGDITSVVAGTNLNGGGSSGTVTVNLDSDITLTSVTADEFYGDLYGAIHILVKNVSGGSLTKGTPVYATGAVGASGAVEVEASLAGTGSTMPAMGLLDQDLANNGEGDVVVSGVLQHIDTDTPGYSVGDELYVAPSGGLTTTRPSGASELVQKIGKVIRVQQNTGEILVQGAGRTNDVPNVVVAGGLAIDTDTLYVDATNDRVGIGTTSPETPLNIVTTNKLGSTFTGTTDGEGLRVDQSNYTSGNYVSLVEASYDDGQTAPHVRIGAMFDGSGSHLAFGTSNSYASGITNTALFIDETGKVGVGETSPDRKLHVTSTGSEQFKLETTGTTSNRASMEFVTNGDDWEMGARGSAGSPNNSFYLYSKTDAQYRLVVADGGNVGIGNVTAPGYRLDVGGTARFTDQVYVQSILNVTNDLKVDTDTLFVDVSTDRVGINTSSPGYDLTVRTPSGSAGVQIMAASGGYSQLWFGDGGTNEWHIESNPGGTEFKIVETGVGYPFTIHPGNKVGIGTTFPNATLDVAGSLMKASGSFRIPHPLPEMTETHHLVHSFVEAPQADNIYRGRVALVDGSATVDLDAAAGMTAGTFALLNRDVQSFTSNETGPCRVWSSVSDGVLTITAEHDDCDHEISWLVIGERQDQHMYDTEWTDDDGRVIVEPLRPVEPDYAALQAGYEI